MIAECETYLARGSTATIRNSTEEEKDHFPGTEITRIQIDDDPNLARKTALKHQISQYFLPQYARIPVVYGSETIFPGNYNKPNIWNIFSVPSVPATHMTYNQRAIIPPEHHTLSNHALTGTNRLEKRFTQCHCTECQKHRSIHNHSSFQESVKLISSEMEQYGIILPHTSDWSDYCIAENYSAVYIFEIEYLKKDRLQRAIEQLDMEKKQKKELIRKLEEYLDLD